MHALSWLALVLQLPANVVPAGLFLAAGYLAGFFVSQLRSGRVGRYRSVAILVALASALGGLAVVGAHASSAFIVLAAWLLLAAPLIDLGWRPDQLRHNATAGLALLVSLGTVAWLLAAQGAELLDFLVLALAAVMTVAAAVSFGRIAGEGREGRERYSALLSEFRGLKRAAAVTADAARAEERMSVARRLHDSVGHRLTNLLMQLEVDRLGAEQRGEAGEESRHRAEELKRLAQQSLDETRAAVSALGEDELMGMAALLRLINNLEVESAMQVEFTLGGGALNVDLDRLKSIALYRAVQEALTNAMRHGAARRARVRVEVPAGRLVRFEVESDLLPGVRDYEPGFGLTAMRERVEGAGGDLEIRLGGGKFLVRGSFPVSA